MENLKPLRNYISARLITWHLFTAVLSGLVTFALTFFIKGIAPYLLGGALFVLMTVLLSISIARTSVYTTEFLARAILHVSSEKADMPAPNPSSLKAGRQFMERLTAYIYDMSSQSVMAQYPKVHSEQASAIQPVTANNDNSALKSSPLPFFIFDKDMHLRQTSQSGLSFLGTDATNTTGKKLYDILRFSFSSSDTLEAWLKTSSERSVTATRTWERVKVSTFNEEVKQVDISVRFSKDDSAGNEVVVILFDHTERYGRDDSGASFVSMAVHELRTPLTIMRGYIEVFEDELADKLDEEQASFLRNLSVQAQQLGTFVGNIQNLARIESNSLELQLKSDDWSAVLENVLNDMDMRAKVRNKVIVRKIAEHLPPVGIDRTTIFEVLVNILENAIKYTHTDAPIVISAYQKDEDWVETTIEDQGVGIPDSLLGHVFDKFYRSHRSSKSVGGTGLGLYISKTVIEAHGGQIWVKTKEGKGSTFGFTIPTFSSIASEANSSDNKAIERSAHGWIKNHTMYRG